MVLKVMLSSVRYGLADVRDAVAPVIALLDHECVRFEDVTPQPVPPRAVCLRMVEGSDIYLLLLGEAYGDPMPGTDLAPTEEEWTIARNRGTPTVVFRKAGIEPEARQAEFIRTVESYEAGAWRGTFRDVPDLLRQLKPALAAAVARLQPLTFAPLSRPVHVPWRGSDGAAWSTAAVLETHVIPVDARAPLPVSSFADLRRQLARAGVDHGLFEDGQALDFPTTESSVAARARPDARHPEASLGVTRDRAVSVWEGLPSHLGGSVLDEGGLRTRIARDLRLAAALGLLGTDRAAVGVGIDHVDRLGRATGPNSMEFPYFGRSDPLRLEPSDAVSAIALATGADDIAIELAARLLLRLQRVR